MIHAESSAIAIALLFGCSSSNVTREIHKKQIAAERIEQSTVLKSPQFRLPRNFEPTTYHARLRIEERRFVGTIDIKGNITDNSSIVWLHGVDLGVTAATATHDGMTHKLDVTIYGSDELIGLRSSIPLVHGNWTISIDYAGQIYGDEDLVTATDNPTDSPAVGVFRRTVDSDAYFFTHAEPIYARWIFPCIDEPDLKVPWQLTLDVHRNSIALSNSPVIRETILDQEYKRVEFSLTQPLPSYLVAFAVGPFDLVESGKTSGGAKIRVVTQRGRTMDASWAAESTARVVRVIEAWFNIPYPYEKLDLVAVPHSGWLGMENSGLIMFDERLLHVDARDEETRSAQRSTWVGLVGHEVAHQWFGSLVTPKWWDDIWLTESLATWLAEKISLQPDSVRSRDPIEQSSTAMRILAEKSGGIRASFGSADSLKIDRFRQSMDYRFGPAVLSLLEAYIGADQFRRAMHAYATNYAHRNASAEDFVAAIDDVAKTQLGATFLGLVDSTDVPQVTMKMHCESQRAQLEIALSSPAIAWPLPICFAYDRDEIRENSCVALRGESIYVTLAVKACPRWVVPAAGRVAMYRVKWSEVDVDALIAQGWSKFSIDEQRTIFSQFNDKSLELAVVPKLLEVTDSTSLAMGAKALRDARSHASERGRALLDAWVVRKLAPRAKSLRFTGSAGDLSIVELVAKAGEPSHVREAMRLASYYQDLPPAVRRAVLGVAVSADPGIAARVLADVPILPGELRSDVIDALADAVGILDIAKGNRAKLMALDFSELVRLLTSRCDASRQRDVARLADDLLKSKSKIAETMIEQCVKRREATDRAIRKAFVPTK